MQLLHQPTQAKRQWVLFESACLLADDALLLHLNWNGIGKQRHKVRASCAHFLSILTPNFPLPASCVTKKYSAFGGEPKRPRIWAFLAEGF
jgi:hypothetical protein